MHQLETGLAGRGSALWVPPTAWLLSTLQLPSSVWRMLLLARVHEDACLLPLLVSL